MESMVIHYLDLLVRPNPALQPSVLPVLQVWSSDSKESPGLVVRFQRVPFTSSHVQDEGEGEMEATRMGLVTTCQGNRRERAVQL